MDYAQTKEYKKNWDREHVEDIKIRKRIRGALIKKELIKYKGGACSICGYNKTSVALTFHHLHNQDQKKEYDIATKIGNRYSLDFLKKEVDKCVLVCENCHREIHQEEIDKINKPIEDAYVAKLGEVSKASLFKI